MSGVETKAQEARAIKTEPIKVFHTRVFAAGPQGGNPCPVIPFADRVTDASMQALARHFGLETVFILKPTSDFADIRLRYFVPDHEMGVTGHATIAAVTVALLNKTLNSDRTRVETSTGLFESQAVRSTSEPLVTLEQNKPEFGARIGLAAVARALKAEKSAILAEQAPVQSVSVSRAKLLIPIRDSQTLNDLNPDFEAMWRLCEKLQVTGFYPFTRKTDKPHSHAEARQFPLRAGFPEDAATGVAAAALGAYLATYDRQCQTGKHLFRIAQGYAMGAPSLIESIAECSGGKVTRTAIRGTAQIVRQETISL